MRYSFVITCTGRGHDLKQTLPATLQSCPEGSNVVVLDYNSLDGIWGWMINEQAPALQSGKLMIYRESAAPRYLKCHAKNIAHLLGITQPDVVLISVDADNTITPAYVAELDRVDWRKVSMAHSDIEGGGWRGRVAMRADDFKMIGGYDESFIYGYGYEDVDIYVRAFKLRLVCVPVRVERTSVIPTTPELQGSSQLEGLSIKESGELHTRMAENNWRSGRLIANAGNTWGVATVHDWRGLEHRTIATSPMV